MNWDHNLEEPAWLSSNNPDYVDEWERERLESEDTREQERVMLRGKEPEWWVVPDDDPLEDWVGYWDDPVPAGVWN